MVAESESLLDALEESLRQPFEERTAHDTEQELLEEFVSLHAEAYEFSSQARDEVRFNSRESGRSLAVNPPGPLPLPA